MKQHNAIDNEDIEFGKETIDSLKQKCDDLRKKKLKLEQEGADSAKKILELDQKQNDLLKKNDAILVSLDVFIYAKIKVKFYHTDSKKFFKFLNFKSNCFLNLHCQNLG